MYFDKYFGKQEFMVMHKCSAYYASIILNAFKHLLCQHNRQALYMDTLLTVHTKEKEKGSLLLFLPTF